LGLCWLDCQLHLLQHFLQLKNCTCEAKTASRPMVKLEGQMVVTWGMSCQPLASPSVLLHACWAQPTRC
jgi:hypothetical protein